MATLKGRSLMHAQKYVAGHISIFYSHQLTYICLNWTTIDLLLLVILALNHRNWFEHLDLVLKMVEIFGLIYFVVNSAYITMACKRK